MTSQPLQPVTLATWPTPLEPSPRLSVALGLRPDDLWIKRDDLVGLGGGGNKVRKLEWTMALALAAGADVVVTTGAPQSNHARLTAAAGARLGLEVVLVLAGEQPAEPSGNLVLDHLLGARLVWAGPVDSAGLAARASAEEDRLRRDGRTPYVIAFGGSTPAATEGYLTCAREIEQQGARPDHVVVALGSGGTMAGLVRGLGPGRALGVHCGAVPDPRAAVGDLLRRFEAGAAEDDLRIATDVVGEGYEHLGPGVQQACELAARQAGLVLDPTYTGRALAGLRTAVQRGEVRPGERTVFVHTGGLPGLFGHRSMLATQG